MTLTVDLYLIFHGFFFGGGGVSLPCRGILTHLSLCFEGWVILQCYRNLTHLSIPLKLDLYLIFHVWEMGTQFSMRGGGGQFSMPWNFDPLVRLFVLKDGSFYHAIEIWPICHINILKGWSVFQAIEIWPIRNISFWHGVTIFHLYLRYLTDISTKYNVTFFCLTYRPLWPVPAVSTSQ